MLKAGQDKELRTRIEKILADNTRIVDECYGSDNVRITQEYFDADNAITHILAELDSRGYYRGQDAYIAKQERDRIIGYLQKSIELSAKVKEPAIKIKMSCVLQALSSGEK